MDADFCAQFIKVLHLQGTPGFHTLGCYDKVNHLGDFFFFFFLTLNNFLASGRSREGGFIFVQ